MGGGKPPSEAARAPPPLHDIVDALKQNLALDGTWPEVVDAACLQLGVAPTGSLQEKADACWRAMEGNACTSPRKDTACSPSRRGMGKVAPDPMATADESTVVAGGRYWYPHKDCLEIEPRGGGWGFLPFRIEEDTVANDQRILARVSGEEARTYIRGVNARIAKSTRCYRWAARGCIACFFLGAALFGVMMDLFYERERIRCQGRVCARGEDPLVDGCCIFWCCGTEMEEKIGRELRARPSGTSWDVWSNKTYFGDTQRCSLYDEDRPEDHTKRDALFGCNSCPASLLDEEDENRVECKTMYEGEAKHQHEIWWPLLLLIPFLAPFFVFLPVFFFAHRGAVPSLYKEAFEPWVERGVVFHVNSWADGNSILRLWLVRTDEIYSQLYGNVPPYSPDDSWLNGKLEPSLNNNGSLCKVERVIRDASQEVVRLNLPIVLREGGDCSSKLGPGLTDIALPAELVGRVPEEVWTTHTTKLGPIFRGLRSNATNYWCAIFGFMSLLFFAYSFLFFPLSVIHGKYVSKKVDEDLRAWQTSFNADLASHGVFVKTQSCKKWWYADADDGYGPRGGNCFERWLAVAITDNTAAELKAEPHLFGSSADSIDPIGCCVYRRGVCLHTMREV